MTEDEPIFPSQECPGCGAEHPGQDCPNQDPLPQDDDQEGSP